MVLLDPPEVSGLRRRLSAFKTQPASGCETHASDASLNGHAHAQDEEHDGEGGASDITHSSISESISSTSRESEMAEGDGDGDGDGLAPGAADAEDRGVESHEARRYRKRRGPGGRNSEDGTDDSWYSYDLSILVALISPIGNWLTGGDHVKNLLLILLLIFYLHQIIEVPWSLYRMSIPRLSPVAGANREMMAAHHPAAAAHSELRKLEVLYLFLAVLAPLLGATLLQAVSTAVTGSEQTLSWFSTGLFVLATGLRPWRHLVARLRDRSAALHDVLRAAGAEDVTETATDGQALTDLNGALTELRAHVHGVEGRLERVRDKHKEEMAEVRAHLHDVVDAVEKAVRKQQRAVSKAVLAQDSRIAALEAHLATIAARGGTGAAAKPFAQGWYYALRTAWLSISLPWADPPQSISPRRRDAPPPAPSFRMSHHGPVECASGSRFNTHLDPIPEELVPLPPDMDFRAPKKRLHIHRMPLNQSYSTPRPSRAPLRLFGAFLFSPFKFILLVLRTIVTLPQHLIRSVYR